MSFWVEAKLFTSDTVGCKFQPTMSPATEYVEMNCEITCGSVEIRETIRIEIKDIGQGCIIQGLQVNYKVVS